MPRHCGQAARSLFAHRREGVGTQRAWRSGPPRGVFHFMCRRSGGHRWGRRQRSERARRTVDRPTRTCPGHRPTPGAASDCPHPGKPPCGRGLPHSPRPPAGGVGSYPEHYRKLSPQCSPARDPDPRVPTPARYGSALRRATDRPLRYPHPLPYPAGRCALGRQSAAGGHRP